MGSETIIPGTPLDAIPAQDRPVFNAKLQNGYPGAAGNVAQPAPGSLVEHIVVSKNASPAVTGLTTMPTFFARSLGAGANETLDSFFNGGLVTTPRPAPFDLIFTATGSPAAAGAGILVGGAVGAGANLNSLKVPLVLPNHPRLGSGLYISNSDTGSLDYQLTAVVSKGDDLWQTVPFKFDLTGLFDPIQGTDVLRIRRLALQVQPNSNYGYGDGVLAIGLSAAAISGANNPARIVLPLRANIQGGAIFTNAARSAEEAAGPYYLLDGIADILGTDFNLAGQPFSPEFEFDLNVRMDLTGALSAGTVNLWAVLDIYRGANQ